MANTLELHDVTMMEAVHQLRARGVYLQFEREPLTEADTDRSRPVVDSRRRFDARVDPTAGPAAVAATLVAADDAYDAVTLATTPPSSFVRPRAGSALDRPIGAPPGEARTVGDALAALGVKPGGPIEVFDRAGFLQQAPATAVAGDRPLYAILGDLFAGSGNALVWDVTTLDGGQAPVLAVSRLPLAR